MSTESPFHDILQESKKSLLLPACPKAHEKRPRYRYEFRDNWTFTRFCEPKIASVNDCFQVRFDAILGPLARLFGRSIGHLEMDLVWLATAVYVADRFSPRQPYGINGPDYWRRSIYLKLPVSVPEIWDANVTRLTHTLSFLTEDDWQIEFVGGRMQFDDEKQFHIDAFASSPFEWTALFSGGLDSLAGMLQQLQHTQGAGLLVSGQTHARMATAQNEQIAALVHRFPRRIGHVGISYGIPDKTGIAGHESSQRTRAFIHMSLGAIAAFMSGNSKLYLFENGFGALNIPCDNAQIGSQNSRGTHPVFLQRMGLFLSSVFGKQVNIENPFLFSTKAEMLSSPALDGCEELVQKTFSCDRYPNYLHKAPQCGRCPSCLIRRMSLFEANRRDDHCSYTFDVLNINKKTHELRESEILSYTKLSSQVAAFASHLTSPKPWENLTAMCPDILRADMELSMPHFKTATCSLLTRHVKEWKSFESAIEQTPLAIAA